MADHPIKDLMGITMEKIKEMVDTDVIVGKQIVIGDVTLIPVSKVSFGFASGGSDLPTQKTAFGGGGGAGITLQPLGFLTVSGSDVRFLEINGADSTADRIVNTVPAVIDQVSGLIQKYKSEKNTVKIEKTTEEKIEE